MLGFVTATRGQTWIKDEVIRQRDRVGLVTHRSAAQFRLEPWTTETRHWFDRIINLANPNYGKSMQPIGLRYEHHIPARIFHRHAPVRG